MKGYKAFGEGMVCKGKQYAENTVFEEEKAKPCECGMHFCKEPLKVLQYYSAAQAKEFAEVEALDEALTDDGAKFCTTKLKVGARLDIRQLVNAQIEFVREHCTNENNAGAGKPATAGYRGAATAGNFGAATAGNRGAATAGNFGAAAAGKYGAATAGDSGAATAGNYGAATAGESGAATAGNSGAATAGNFGAATAGYRGAATAGNSGAATAGNYGAATAGNYGAATSRGKVSVGGNGAGLVRGEAPMAKGGKGAVLFIVKEAENSYDISDFCSVIVGKDGIKPDTWYTVEKGKAVEVDAN